MSAGTLTLANNSDVVSGIDTSFTTELAAGDFIVATLGGVTYTLPVKTISSDTDLKLARNYNGPGISGIAWTAMPRDTLNRISAQMAADTAYIIGQRVLEVENWYQLLEVNGDVVIKMADGSSYTGPSWLKLIDVMKAMQIDELIPIAEQIRADAQQVADDKPVIIQAKDDAQAAAAAAAESENNAATSEKNAAASKDTAAQKAEEAAESARQAAESNPLLALQKSLNLSDLDDKEEAWLNVRPEGATPLAADPVGPYDATTQRWVENRIDAGTAGPTMNGVMNYHVGEAVPWETRAYYPPNCLPRDGQLVNRADWPELWAWAQKTTPITDAAWLADVAKRGSYSTGNGTTTFRLPDWNGVQSGSIPGVFFRGGVGAADMLMALNAAPDIQGSFASDNAGVAWQHATTADGAFDVAGFQNVNIFHPESGYARWNGNSTFTFKASKYNAAYGRNSTAEVVPNKVSGVWLVRASGGFVAANTSWSVINGDSTTPPVGTVTNGGKARSQYNVGTVEKHSAEFFSVWNTNSTISGGIVRVTYNGTTVKEFVFDSEGSLTIPYIVGASHFISKGIGYNGGLFRYSAYASTDANSVNQVYYVQNAGSGLSCYQVTVPGVSYQHVWRLDHDGQNKYFSIRSDNQMYTPIGAVAIQGCDVRIKNGFEPPKAGAWDRIQAIGICEFMYNGSTTPQRGPLAQQMGDIDPMYVFEGGTATDENGVEFEILNVNEKAVMADMITVIQALQQKVTDLEALLKNLQQ